MAKGATRMDWPGEQSVPGVEKKEKGFWKDRRTLWVLWGVKQGALLEEDATGMLRTLPSMPGHPKSDVEWYIDRYDKKGWPPMRGSFRVDS